MSDGVIQCGSFTTDASGNANTVNLGWEPQYVMVKLSSTTGNWITVDNMRGMPVGSNDQQLYPNLANAETSGATLSPTATGFDATTLTASQTYIYLAIRRGPMRVPTDGTKVYNAIARTGTGAAATVTGVGFAPDVCIVENRAGNGDIPVVVDRLRGMDNYISTAYTSAEAGWAGWTAGMDGVAISGTVFNAASPYINYFFRRAPGFFDQVAYTGTGVARTIAHNLKSVPGMIWVKCRSNAVAWWVYHKSLGGTMGMMLNSTDMPGTFSTIFNDTDPTSTVFSVGIDICTESRTYAAYLFGDTPGLCKAGSYTGNGSNQDIACGFAPRFVLIKRTANMAGDWKVFDSTRGIVSGNDFMLALNSIAAEVTDRDQIDPIANGFNITQNTTDNLNVNNSTYIFWASA